MPEPIGSQDVSQLLKNPALGRTRLLNPQQQDEGADFKSTLLDSLDEVNRLQLALGTSDLIGRHLVGIEQDHLALK